MIPMREVTKDVIKAAINGPVPIVRKDPAEISVMAKTEEPKITGMDSKKEKRTAVSLFSPVYKPAIRVLHEREIPGITARV